MPRKRELAGSVESAKADAARCRAEKHDLIQFLDAANARIRELEAHTCDAAGAPLQQLFEVVRSRINDAITEEKNPTREWSLVAVRKALRGL